jgi:hypothetical protein
MSSRGMIIVLCVGIGTALGVATNHVATWASVGAGVALALAIGKSCCGGSCEQKQGRGNESAT